jgi:hypothetical protein
MQNIKSNVAYQSNATNQCGNVAHKRNAAEQKRCSISKKYGNVAYQNQDL